MDSQQYTILSGPVDVYDNAATPVYQASYATITAALGHVGLVAGWTILVQSDASGYDSTLETYPINVNVAGVIVKSAAGAAATTIDATGLLPVVPRCAVQITANNVTFGGSGFTIIAADDDPATAVDTYGVEIWLNVDGVTIQDNIITGQVDSPQVGIHIWGDSAASEEHVGVYIYNNDISTAFTTDPTRLGSPTSAGIASPVGAAGSKNIVGGQIISNTVSGYSVGMNLDGLDATIDINENTVHSNDYNGISVSSAAPCSPDVDLLDNDVYDNGGNGIADSIVGSTVDIYCNRIRGNGNGIKLYPAVSVIANHTIQYNDIYSNNNTVLPVFVPPWGPAPYENYGVLNLSGAGNVDAKYNWWGAEGGPAPGTDANKSAAMGNGDAVSANVLYDPWLTELGATVIAGGIRWYGSDAIPLGAGWNTLSVPVVQKGSVATFGDVQALGTFLTPFVTAYYYDAQAGLWVYVTNATTISCGQGFYVNMSQASKFPVLYNGVIGGLPSYSTYSGWNLVGSMFGVDKTAPGDGDWGVATPLANAPATEAEDEKMEGDALGSLAGQASVVVSPALPNQIGGSWSEIYAGTGAGSLMYTGDAYWVFVNANGTLAGFEVTPFFFVYGGP